MVGDLSAAKTDYSHGIYAQIARDIFHRLKSLLHFMKSIVGKFSIVILKRIKQEAIEGSILFSITTQFQILSIDCQNDIYIVKIAVSNSDLYLNKNQKIQSNYVINSNILVV